MSEDWERYAAEHVHFLDESISQLLVKYLTSFRWQVFLDVGCGDGSLLFALDRRGFFKGKVVFAVDISAKRIEAVRGINSAFRCFVDDACKLENIDGDSVDMLVSLQVIEHVPSDNAMIHQIHRVLTQDGVAYITTVFKKPSAWYFYRNASGESVIDPTHVREYKDDQLLSSFNDHGFEILESRRTQERKAVLGASILGRIGATKESLIEHPFLKAARRIKIPVPGYYNWEIVVSKKKDV
jgi:SAM-dependent methyltransferase